MKFRKVNIFSDFFELEIPYCSIFVHLETKIESGSSCYIFELSNYDFYLNLVDNFGSLEVSSLKFVDDCVYVCFNLDNDLFVEFKNYLVNGGF